MTDAYSPKVTVLMSVYNGEQYIEEAIDSILSQTFPDFEFLIIDDASTDNSFNIISKYTDNRIKIIQNEDNLGLTKSLNKGLKIAKGEYIARMDADDISIKERLEKQIKYLESDPSCVLISCFIDIIDKNGISINEWTSDIRAQTYELIRDTLPRENCIAHSTIMFRRSILEKYSYNQEQIHSQDYDLYLNLVSDGIRIGKITEKLVKYRSHPKSITAITNQNQNKWKTITLRYKYLIRRIANKKINFFDLRVFEHLIIDIFYSCFTDIKYNLLQLLKEIIIKMGVSFGFLISPFFNAQIYFFFPVYHIGGAEKVHANIIKCVKQLSPIIFFTKKSNNNAFKNLFKQYASIFDISTFTSNPILTNFCVGAISSILNKNKPISILGSNSVFFYRLLPRLDPKIRCIDLIHAFGGGIENIGIFHVKRLDIRIVINSQTKRDLSLQYEKFCINKSFHNRIILIENFVEIPQEKPKKEDRGILRILYVGRGTEEKRVNIIAKIAKYCHKRNIPANFIFVGDVANSIERKYYEYCQFLGEITDENELIRIYEESHILLLVSRYEGFPLVIMEAMAHGVIPISTKAGGISDHIQNGKNGYLIENHDEKQIIFDALDVINQIAINLDLRNELSEASYNYAKKNFNGRDFCPKYSEILYLYNN